MGLRDYGTTGLRDYGTTGLRDYGDYGGYGDAVERVLTRQRRVEREMLFEGTLVFSNDEIVKEYKDDHT